MRVAALYDIHGNLPALEAVLAEVDADLILVGGDAVAGPWPAETLERLHELGERVRFIGGNAVVCGHAHVQFDRRIGETRLVNSGSVGMPYEDEPGAYWTLLGPNAEFRRTEYEPGDIAASAWPGEWPGATAQEATEFFEGLSLGQV